MATHLRLPEGEHLVIEALEGGGFEARAIYLGGDRTRIGVATSSHTDLARLVRLAAHEAYPGHHLQHVWADQSCVREQGWTERTLHPAFGPHVLIAEGAAEAGAVLLLERHTLTQVCSSLAVAARTPITDVGAVVAVDRAVTSLDEVVAAVAQAYLDGEIGSEAAADRLRDEALVPDATQLLGVIERLRTRVLAYPAGRRLVTEHVFAQPAGERWAALQAAATIPILVSSSR